MRRAMTLVELLIVCFILVLAIAMAAPLLRPATADRKTREAARQINAFLAEAKAYAAQRGRPVGVAFDRSQAAREGARDPNIVTRLYLAESPPTYAGDVLDATVQLQPLPRYSTAGNDVMDLQQPPWYDYPDPTTVVERNPPEINGIKADWHELAFQPPLSNTMLHTICAGYLGKQPAYPFVPLRFKLEGRGGWCDGYCWYTGTASPPVFDPANPGEWRYFLWASVGRIVPPPMKNGRPNLVSYQVEFPPIGSGDYGVDLPTGTVIDLRYSGFGTSGVQFGSGGTDPLVLVFDPGGFTDRIFANGTHGAPPMKMHFLVGTSELAIQGQSHQTSNLSSASSQWVSVNAGQGVVSTSENTPPTDYSTLPAAVTQARTFATTLQQTGGR
jgi:type II secretory pathway pseudopilin PulG